MKFVLGTSTAGTRRCRASSRTGKNDMKHLGLIAAGAALAFMASTAKVEAQSTFDQVKAKGFVQCGVNTSLPGFSAPDSQGVWRGLDVDMCRAVAAAMFGDATKVRYTPT